MKKETLKKRKETLKKGRKEGNTRGMKKETLKKRGRKIFVKKEHVNFLLKNKKKTLKTREWKH